MPKDKASAFGVWVGEGEGRREEVEREEEEARDFIWKQGTTWKVFAELGNRLGGLILVVAFPVSFLKTVSVVTSPPTVSD